jgi:hypothetical protein
MIQGVRINPSDLSSFKAYYLIIRDELQREFAPAVITDATTMMCSFSSPAIFACPDSTPRSAI